MTLWAKLYTDILGDTKLMRASRKGARQLVLLPWLIAFAKACDDDGRLSVNGEPAEPIDIADKIPGVTAPQVASCLRALTEIGVLLEDPDGVLRLAAWEWRSGNAKKPSDAPERVGERVTRHRAKKRAERNDSNAEAVTPVTPLEQEQEKEPDREAEQEPELRESARDDIESSVRIAFAGYTSEIERFIATRKPATRENWLREMLKIAGPGARCTPEDVAGACSDALALDKAIEGPHALRAFAEKRRQERTVPPTERVGARRGPGLGVISASDAFVDKIMALMISSPGPTGGIGHVIPKTKVAEMGAPVLTAYESVGGADRFIAVKKDPEKLPWLRREFADAFARAISSKPRDDDSPPAVAV